MVISRLGTMFLKTTSVLMKALSNKSYQLILSDSIVSFPVLLILNLAFFFDGVFLFNLVLFFN